MGKDIKLEVLSSCILKTNDILFSLNGLTLTLTDNYVYGEFKSCYGGKDVVGVNGMYNLCSRVLVGAQEYFDTLNLDVDVDFKTNTFKAARDYDFMFSKMFDFGMCGLRYKEIK